MKLTGWILFSIMVFLWALNWSMMKIGLGIASPFTFVLHRYLFSIPALVMLVFMLKTPMPKERRILGKVAVAGLLNLGSILMVNIGLSSYSSGISSVITYSHPLITFCFAILFLKEAKSTVRLFGTIVGFIGVLVLFFEANMFINSISVGFLFIGAFFWSANTIYCKKILNNINAVFLNTFQTIVGVPFLVLFSFGIEKPLLPITLEYGLIVLYGGVGAIAISSTIWYYLLRREDATILSTSSFIVPVMALVFGELLLGEIFDAKTLIGCFLVLIGIYLVNRRS